MRKLVIRSLTDELRDMAIGETCIAPDECSVRYVRLACSMLRRKEGYEFLTSTSIGQTTVTRLK